MDIHVFFNQESQKYDTQWEQDGFIFNCAMDDYAELQDYVLDSVITHGGDANEVRFHLEG